jgi:hypothetical protein
MKIKDINGKIEPLHKTPEVYYEFDGKLVVLKGQTTVTQPFNYKKPSVTWQTEQVR